MVAPYPPYATRYGCKEYGAIWYPVRGCDGYGQIVAQKSPAQVWALYLQHCTYTLYGVRGTKGFVTELMTAP